jgi:O-6-methylguanine DNA methyltransferase
MKVLHLDRVDTPLGELWLLATGRGLCSARFAGPKARVLAEVPSSPSRKTLIRGGAFLRRASEEVSRYFAGERRAPEAKLDLSGLPRFEQAVLRAVRSIPPGETRTYAQIAAQAGAPRSTRRVQSILVRNPLPLFVPCHRVVAEGALGPYVGGRARKKRLLDMERGQIAMALKP